MSFHTFMNQYFPGESTHTDSSHSFIHDYEKNDIYDEIQRFSLPIQYLSSDSIYSIQPHVKDDLKMYV